MTKPKPKTPVVEKLLPPDQCVTLIAELDKMLSMMRGVWIEARDDGERTKSMERINGMLDERMRLMRMRDLTT